MELFRNAKAVRLWCPDGWYLQASEGEVSATANRDGSSPDVLWRVEVVDANNIRLRSCYGKYLTGLPDNVFQSPPEDLSPSANWEPISEGGNNQLVRLRTSGGYLLIDRGTGSFPSGHNTRVVYLIRNPKRNRATKDGTPWEIVVVERMGLPSPYYSATSSGFARKKV